VIGVFEAASLDIESACRKHTLGRNITLYDVTIEPSGHTASYLVVSAGKYDHRYYSGSQMWIWAENVACVGEKGNTGLRGKPERERLFGIRRYKLEDNIKIYPTEAVWGMCGLD